MGVYNTYGEKEIQLKVGDLCLKRYSVGDKCDIDDGIYVGYEGIVVIQNGLFVGEYEATPSSLVTVGKICPNALIYDKWGTIISKLSDLERNNPIKKALEDLGFD